MKKHTFRGTTFSAAVSCSALLGAAGLCGVAAAAPAGKDAVPQPVYVMLYSRYSDHVVPQLMEQRMSRLLPIMEQLKKDEPSASVLLQFSGAVMEPLKRMDAVGGHIGRLKDLARRGLAEFGYDGMDEPTYRNRPRPLLRTIPEPERRWIARGEAEDVFLTQYRAPFTGNADPSKPGGLKLVQETLGELATVGNWAPYVGNDAAELNRLNRLNRNSALYGFLTGNPEWGIEGYGGVVDAITSRFAAAPGSAPEVYWEGGRLRIAEAAKRGTRPVSATEGVDALKKFVARLDRSVPHVIEMEIVGETRYLTLRIDGTVQWPPLVWAYDHPDDPLIPVNIKAFQSTFDLEKDYQKEQETLTWLVKEFFPANPGSRFVSVAGLKKATGNATGSDVPAAEIREAAESLRKAYAAAPSFPGEWAQARGHYYSMADMFELLAAGLAQKGGKVPESVRLGSVYGPIEAGVSLDENQTEVDAASVVKAATAIAAGLRDESWKAIPSNMVPSTIVVEGKKMNAARFLDLMAQVYLGATGKVTANKCMMLSAVGVMYPRNTPTADLGSTWTIKPAPLKLQ